MRTRLILASAAESRAITESSLNITPARTRPPTRYSRTKDSIICKHRGASGRSVRGVQ